MWSRESSRRKNDFQIHLAQKRIHLQHAIILSLGGIPMIYSGDEIVSTNFYNYLNESDKNTITDGFIAL